MAAPRGSRPDAALHLVRDRLVPSLRDRRMLGAEERTVSRSDLS
jgi:hypothetical protein